MLDLGRVRTDEALELACKAHLGVWAEQKRGLVNGALHWEWSELAMCRNRLCVVAPREHAKSEVFTVNQAAWRIQYTPGVWVYVFGQTGDQAVKLKGRVDQAVSETAPWLMEQMPVAQSSESVYSNWSRLTVAGSGKGVRGAHPDLIVGDDVLEEGMCLTDYQRKKVERWWLGTIGGMSHPGTWRLIGPPGRTRRVWMPPTRVHLVGTPFHQQDLLMSMRENPLYEFRRYAAEFDPMDLVDGLAVEVN